METRGTPSGPARAGLGGRAPGGRAAEYVRQDLVDDHREASRDVRRQQKQQDVY